jgi:hypothetical protein
LRCRHLLISLLDPSRQPWRDFHRGLDQALDLGNERVLLRGTDILLQLLRRLLLLSLTLLGAGASLGEAAKEIGEEWHG